MSTNVPAMSATIISPEYWAAYCSTPVPTTGYSVTIRATACRCWSRTWAGGPYGLVTQRRFYR